MERQIIIAGSGGQGILYLGKALAFASMIEGREVTWFPAYGAEMRGGTAYCTVVISYDMIGSPVVTSPDILIAMNAASLVKFQPRLKSRGLLCYDSSLISGQQLRRDIACLPVPAARMASSEGTTRSGNMVMLGAVVARSGILPPPSVLKVFEGGPGSIGGRGSDMNITLIKKGIRYVEDTQGHHPRS